VVDLYEIYIVGLIAERRTIMEGTSWSEKSLPVNSSKSANKDRAARDRLTSGSSMTLRTVVKEFGLSLKARGSCIGFKWCYYVSTGL